MGILDDILGSWHRRCCCPPPPQVTDVAVSAGGGSMETLVTWDPLPAAAQVAHYRVYRRKGAGTWWLLAIADDAALGLLQPGRIGVVDAPDYWPWPTIDDGSGERCYAVAAVSTRGLEGPWSAEACGTAL